MNKIYALKYSVRHEGFVPVSEFSTRVKKSARMNPIALSSLIASMLLGGLVPAKASVVRGDVPYQTIRDFAGNKSEFSPGAINIDIYDKQGSIVGHLDKVPMADFSSASYHSAIATLVSPQYIASVKHNNGYQDVSFGDGNNDYWIVDRNNHPSRDLHVPRLNKLVTEVVPTPPSDAGTISNIYTDKNRFPAFYRIGSGVQQVRDKSGVVSTISGGYDYLTGGTVGSPGSYSNGTMISSRTNDTFNPAQGPLATYGRPGDSGSPLFAYDTLRNSWVIVGTLSSGGGGGSNWTVVPADFVRQMALDDSDLPVTHVAGAPPLKWTFNRTTGSGVLEQGTSFYAMHGKKNNDLNAGKNLVFQGDDGNVLLKNSVNQGAGALTFNSNYTVSTDNYSTWQGAGLDIAKGAVVNWQVNGVKDDNLHKLGEGTLNVNGIGNNPGGLKVGDGTVLLNQRPDSQGLIQAFSSVNIASGRPVVIMGGADQINPDNISWGYRGGKLDVSGNDLTFHQLSAADYGAEITNHSRDIATLTFSSLLKWNGPTTLRLSGGVYENYNEYTQKNEYFVLDTTSKGWQPGDWELYLPPALRASQYFGDNRDAALLAGAESERSIFFHGKFSGNLNIQNNVSLVQDGSVDIAGIFTQENGRLVFQGHPVIHAYNSAEIAGKLKSLGDNSVKTQPVSFEQPDWENRTFSLQKLMLENADFRLARNATLSGDIEARHSTVMLGSPDLYIDLDDGNGSKVTPQKGTSVAGNLSDMSRYTGRVMLNGQSTLDIREIFNGSIRGQDSTVIVTSRHAVLDDYSQFMNTPVTLEKGAALTATGGWLSDSAINVTSSSTLNLTAEPVGNSDGQVGPSFYTLYGHEGYHLESGSTLQISPFTFVSGDIHADTPSTIDIGRGNDIRLADNLPFSQHLAYSLFEGFKNVYAGSVQAPLVGMSMTDTLWQMSGDSRIGSLTLNRSMSGFTGQKPGFSTLTVDTLKAEQSAFALRTDLKNSDRIVVNQKAEGRDNILFVNFLKKPSGQSSLNIPLVSSPAGTDPSLFKAAERVTGFSLVTPVIHVEDDGSRTKWVLDGYKSAPDKGSVTSANSFMGMGYKNFITEVNNLNKRMGDLRDIQGEDGMWVRVMNGAGSGDAGYSDRYTHLQTGFDKKHRLSGTDLFTGILMSYTNSSASGRTFSGNTHSLGGGLYASALLDNGIYVDVIGKYIHHDNDYNARFADLGKQDYSTHSWYAGMETGYRYHLTDSLYVEPQAELVYGMVSGTTLKWNDNGMDLSMRNKNYNPLIGRTGMAVGKTFSGKDWNVTARAGVDWQFDLLSNGETALLDASGEKRFTGEKDSRMLYNVGLNAQMKDNMRLGLELEQSAFGKYNVDHAINANFRYIF